MVWSQRSPSGCTGLPWNSPFIAHQRGQDGRDQAGLEGQVHGLGPARMHEHPPQLLGDPLGGDAGDLPGHRRRAARVAGSIWSWNRAASRMARRQRSLSSRNRAAGSPMARRMRFFEVGLAPDVVDHFAGERVHEHAVDREVAASGVELGRAEDDRFGAPAVDIGAVAAEGRDLDFDALAPRMRGRGRRRTRSRP